MKLLCFGDSNTYGYDPRSYFGGRYDAEQRWVDLLSNKMGCEAVNLGQNGLGIPNSDYYNDVFGAFSDVELLIIMLGSNDLLMGLSAHAAAKRMERFLSRITVESDKILLVSPCAFKPGFWVESEKLIEQSCMLAEEYLKVSQSLGIAYVDAAKWDIELCYDGVHFTDKGHIKFAEEIYKTIKYIEEW